MPHPHSGDVNVVPTDVINAGLPAATFGPTLAAGLAGQQFSGLTSLQLAQIQAQSSAFGASTSAAAQLGSAGIGAQATVQSAGISAQSRVDTQLIATNGAIAQNNAQMKADAVRAAAGDIAAYRRLLQEQQYDAQLQNNRNRMEIAKLSGSGSLFDSIAARNAIAGQGGLPQAGGAFGLGGGIQEVIPRAGNAPLSIEEILKFIPQAAQQSGSGTNFLQNAPSNFSVNLPSAPSFGNFESPNIGDIFSGLNESVFNDLSQFPGDLITPVDPSQVTQNTFVHKPAPVAGSPEAIAATQAAFKALLAQSGSGSTFTAHGGGEIKKGESAIVGDAPGGKLTPFSELIKVTDKGVKITPLNGFRGGFHGGTAGDFDHSGPHSPAPTPAPSSTPPVNPNGVLSDVNNLPALQTLRGNPQNSIFDFGFKFERPESGISELPSPFQFGENFLTMPFSQKQDVLDFYASQFFGAGSQAQTQNLFNQSQPGFRNTPGQAFQF